MKVLKSLLCLSLVLFFVIIFSKKALAVDLLPAPTLIAPNETTVTAKVKPLIIGLTRSDSLVKIFIDGVYNGKTVILKHESNTANFAYKPFLNLSRGWHEVYVIAEDSTGRVSQMSEILRFNIELPMPAPTVLTPVVNMNTSVQEPFIVGLAKNDSKIKVYIDKKYNGEFEVKNHQSGTANFAYKPVEPLTRGNHLVYAVAVDKRGKQSEWSNVVYFSTKDSAIAQSAQEEKSDTVAKIEEPEEAGKINSEAPIISDSFGIIEKKLNKSAEVLSDRVEADKTVNQQDKTSLEKIKSIISGETDEKAKIGQGMVDEGNLNQGKLRLNLALFILFLVGVVAWLIWVNRELVKERRAQNEAENNSVTGGQKDKLL